jgi:hypothetical protein
MTHLMAEVPPFAAAAHTIFFLAHQTTAHQAKI